MKLTRSQIILITGLVLIILAGISVPVGIYLYNQSHGEDNQENDNSTTTSSGTTTTPGPVEDKIITDLEHIEDTLKKFSDDVATLLIRPKLFREEVEHFKTSSIPFFEAIEAEKESNTTTSSSTSTTSASTTKNSTSTSSSTTSSSTISTSTTMSSTTSPAMSDFENLTEIMDVKLQLVNNITQNILDHQPLTNLMDEKLHDLNSNFSQLDQKMIENITLSDNADIDLANILIGKFNVTLNNVKISLDFLQDVKSSSVSTTTSSKIEIIINYLLNSIFCFAAMTTSQTFESLAVSKLKVMNETFDIMIEKLAEMVHSSTQLKFKNDQFSQIYDKSLTIIQALNATQSNINVTHGIITQNLLNNITNLQNQTSVLSNQLQSLTNLTTADEDLAVELIARFTGAQMIIGGVVDVIQQQTTTSSTPSTPSSSTKSNLFNQDMFQRLARRKQRRGGQQQQPTQSS